MTKINTAKILVKGLFSPSDWIDLQPALGLKRELEKYFGTKVYPVNSGRSAIYLVLKAAGIGEGDEVIIQAYTCNAVPNPIIWTGAMPIYADIQEDTLNVDPKNLEAKITKRTKAIILQHTFGRPGSLEEVLKLAKANNLLLIEDCAHSLGGSYKGKKLGTFGDAAIISFGREKVVSALAGGAILINNPKLEKPVENEIEKLTFPSFITYLKEFNNFFTWRLLIRKLFFTNLGTSLLNFLNRQEFFNVVTSQKELVGEKPAWYPKLLPGTFAKIALAEFPKVELANKHRNKIAGFYEEKIKNPKFKLLKPHSGVYLRFAVLAENPEPVFEEARKRKFWFGNWYNTPVYPNRVDLSKMHYEPLSCPKAEKAANQTINLPNYQGMAEEEAQEIVDFINSYES
ncbi:MAG: aminotransferase class I/II-fold pyridoxal phosphate-dependent enzyme [Candidatus Woykebacteria bacterium]